MIPEWSANGGLPPGVHFATWRELEDRLDFNPRGHRMLAGFRQGVCEFLPGEQDERRTERDFGNPAGKEQAKVIKNEKQYRITKAQVRRFQDAVAELAGQDRPSNISARLWKAQREAALSQMEELREQVAAYERLNAGQSKEVLLEGVEDLPKALIRARIAAGMTQEGLARRLGVKPQQVQRYEATEYESASFARILKVVHALGLSMPRAVRLVRNG
jgi:ribosome-binding protein aMBF1 (putative translation factor)